MSTKRKFTARVNAPIIKSSIKSLGKSRVDDSRMVVVGGTDKAVNSSQDVVEISSESASGSADEEGDDSEDEVDGAGAAAPRADVSMADADTTLNQENEASNSEDQEAAEPSFGDLVRVNASEAIDVAGAFDDPSQALSYPQGSRAIAPPSGASLGTVLTQALKTNDVSLLESCLHTTDLNTIRATIQRLNSPLAGTLLKKLAERLHRRPGRAGSLMVWVQWTLVTHGGYLATQRDLIQKLAELNRVIEQRAKGLQSLLSLKGKLDMLESQMQLRRSMQGQARGFDEDDEEDVIYVEGQEDSDSEEAEEAATAARPKKMAANGDLMDISEGESDDSDDMPTTANGIIGDSGDEDDSEDDLIDDEAEETDADSGDEDEVDHDDQDSEEEDESDDAAPSAPPTKMQRVGGMFSKKR